MKRRQILVLLAVAGLLAGGGILLWRGQPGTTGRPVAATAKPAPPTHNGHPQKVSGLEMPLHQARLTAAEKQRLDADPAKAVAGDPKNLDLLVAWAARDPDAALAWINGHPMTWVEDGTEISSPREHLLGAIAAGILIRDGAAAMQRFVAAHDQDPEILPKHQGELLQYAMFNLGRADSIEAALPLMHGEDAAELAGMMVLGVDGTHNMTRAIDYLEAKGIKVAVDYWAFQAAIDADPRYWADWSQQRDSDLLVEIVHGWARTQPTEVRSWLNDRLPTTDPRRTEIEELLEPVTPSDP